MLKIGYLQFRPLFGKISHNLNQIVESLRNVSADIIVIPELAFSGYYFKDRDEVKALALDPFHSPEVDSLLTLCRERNFYLVAGFAEKAADKYFNSAMLAGPDGIIHIYRKLHLFNEEKNWFDAGDTPLQVNEIRGARIGIMICFDWIFPEVTRILTLQGADIICHPSNLVLSYCQNAMLTRCLENHVFAITANRFGADKRPHGTLKFTGKSQIVAPKGVLLHRSASQNKELFITEINPEEARQKDITGLNEILSDRRPEYYDSLVRQMQPETVRSH